MSKLILIILDGWGIGPNSKANAIKASKTPVMDRLLHEFPHATLSTSGEDVGLPQGQMGNSEVGHLNIGAGRIVYQDLVKIHKSIREKELDKNPVLLTLFDKVKQGTGVLHLMGLVSDGGIHSHDSHLHHLVKLASANGIKQIFIHAITDGRDCDPKSGVGHLKNLEIAIQGTPAKVASICGRYYAMDRDKRWERVKLAYDLLVHGTGEVFQNPEEALSASYAKGVTDEFVKPVVISTAGPNGKIKSGDGVLCFNFRTDRCREITTVLTQKNMPDQGMQTVPVHFVTMTNYDDSFKGIEVIFRKDNLENTMGEMVSMAGKTQVRIAETEKYPHVSFFFSGGREEPFTGERRILIPSPKVPTYDLQPSMSAREVTNAIIQDIIEHQPDFICLNFANPDMVGHTGVFNAVIEAIETVDECLGKVLETAHARGYKAVIIADHGNADFMVNDDGSPNTAHTTNPVPLIITDKNISNISAGRLCDLAPTMLKLMGIAIPREMTGKVLVS